LAVLLSRHDGLQAFAIDRAIAASPNKATSSISIPSSPFRHTGQTNNINKSFSTRTFASKIPGQDTNVDEAETGEANKGDSQSDAASSRRTLVLTFAGASMAMLILGATMGLLPGPVDGAARGGVLPYPTDMILRDVGTSILTGTLGFVFVKLTTFAATEKGWINTKDSRKLIHTFSAPLFILFWPLFSPALGAKYFAALVPCINAVRLWLASTGEGETSLMQAVSRDGNNPNEAIQGPFIYVVILAASILCFWRDSPIGIVALSTLAVGDMIGRRFGKSNQWPGLNKSVAGSLAFWAGSTVASVGLLFWMQSWGILALPVGLTIMDIWVRVACICFISAALELVPLVDDNYTVPISAGLGAALLLQ
jgi:phytol kinase